MIVVVALIVGISMTVINFQNNLNKIDQKRELQQSLDEIERENLETERLLNEFENN